MELAQVRYFLSLCKTLNFTRAAAQCNVTQPAFTRAIQKLEGEFGGPLLYRERNLTQLTELGRMVRPHLEAMLEAADTACALAASQQGRAPVSLKIGLGPGIGANVISQAVREVVSKVADVTIHFQESGSAALIEAMLNGMIDCALLPEYCDMPERLNRWPLYVDRAVAVLPPQHALEMKNAVTSSDVAAEPILVGDHCGGFAQRLGEVSGMQLQLQRCGGAVSQLLDLVAAGLGLALMSDRLRYAAPLTVRPFHEPELTRGVLLTAVAGRPLNVAASAFVKLCRAQSFQ